MVASVLPNVNNETVLLISFLYVCMVNTIYLFSFVETPRKFIIAIINLRGVSTKLNKYILLIFIYDIIIMYMLKFLIQYF